MSTRRQAQSQEIQARDLLFLVPGTPFFVFAQVLKEPSVEDDEGDDEDDEEEASSRHSTSEVDPAPSGNDIGKLRFYYFSAAFHAHVHLRRNGYCGV